MKKRTERLHEIVSLAPVIPVLQTDDRATAVEAARIMVEAGLPVVEVPVRSKPALDVLAAVAKVPGIVVGAGSMTNAALMIECMEMGAQWVASPGTSQNLLMGAKKLDVPYLPGVATPSEALGLLGEGYEIVRWFPAEASGGAAALSLIAAALGAITFCPIGGITSDTAPAYRTIPNVAAIGGTWIASATRLGAGDMEAVALSAQGAAGL